MKGTLFEQYGGFTFVSKVISAFYKTMLDSDRVGGYFVNVNMPQLMDHQTKFFATLMGGPASFSDQALLRAHENLKIDEAAFNEVVLILKETLEDFDMDVSDIGVIVAEFHSKKELIVSA